MLAGVCLTGCVLPALAQLPFEFVPLGLTLS